jgi:hypothetical protein
MYYKYILFSVVVLVAGCMNTPSLEFDGAGVSDIVQRVRCEIAEAMPREDDRNYPIGKYSWLRDWTAKVDLTLETVDTAAITANTSYIEPLRSIGSIAQTFTLGSGASVSGTADRIDKLSFTVSVRELLNLKNSIECELPRQRGLLGHLGLGEWIEASLVPVDEGRLFIGFHEAPGKTAGKLAGPGTPSPASKGSDSSSLTATEVMARLRQILLRLKPITTDLDNARTKIAEGETHILNAQRAANQAQVHALRYKGLIRTGATTELQSKRALKEMKATYTKVRSSNREAELGLGFLEVGKVLVWSAKKDIPVIKRLFDDTTVTVNNAEKSLGSLTDAEILTAFSETSDRLLFIGVKTTVNRYADDKSGIPKELDQRVKDASELVTTTAKIANEAWAAMPQNTPLDSVAHTIKFTAVANANVTPNWSLVRFKGPGLGNTPFANATRTRYHTLDIVLGSPGTPGTKEMSEEQRRQLFNLRYEAARVLVIPTQ